MSARAALTRLLEALDASDPGGGPVDSVTGIDTTVDDELAAALAAARAVATDTEPELRAEPAPRYLVTLGDGYTEEPEHYAVATHETLRQTLKNAARDYASERGVNITATMSDLEKIDALLELLTDYQPAAVKPGNVIRQCYGSGREPLSHAKATLVRIRGTLGVSPVLGSIGKRELAFVLGILFSFALITTLDADRILS